MNKNEALDKVDFSPTSKQDALAVFRKANGWREDTVSAINMYGAELAKFADHFRREGVKLAFSEAGPLPASSGPEQPKETDFCDKCNMMFALRSTCQLYGCPRPDCAKDRAEPKCVCGKWKNQHINGYCWNPPHTDKYKPAPAPAAIDEEGREALKEAIVLINQQDHPAQHVVDVIERLLAGN